jgi:hypothetical protein
MYRSFTFELVSNRTTGKYRTIYAGRFKMFSLITKNYNKKTKRPTLMELFTATGKQNKIFFDNCRCSMCAPRVTRHTSIRYSSSCHTRARQHICIDILHCRDDPCLKARTTAAVARLLRLWVRIPPGAWVCLL